jgi:TolA-binding protein
MKSKSSSYGIVCILLACTVVFGGCWGSKFVNAPGETLETSVKVDSLLQENAKLQWRIHDLQKDLQAERDYSRAANAQLKLDIEEIKDQLNALQQAQRDAAGGSGYQAPQQRVRPGEEPEQDEGDSAPPGVAADSVSGTDGGAATQPDTATAGSSDAIPSSVEIHRQVYLDFSRGEYELALEESEVFLEAYPDDPLGEEIHFLRGECFSELNRHFDALKEYSLILQQYPGSSRVPACLFRMAVSYEYIGEREIAAGIVRRLIREYPYSEEAGAAEDRFRDLLEE